MPLQATSGAASYDATGGGAPVRNFIEDVFSTYLYTGNGSTQTITNGIDLTGKGGLVWMKGRSGATAHGWYDTARGATFDIGSNLTTAQTTQSTGLTSFGSTGFSLGALAKLNTNTSTYASWTFRKQPKFFDVVTYTGTGANRTVAHSLGSVPGCIFVKRTDTTGAWQVYHRSLANTEYMVLNTTAAVATGATRWNSTTPTSTEFSLGTDVTVNASGGTYVAYVFAHDAGGFGLTGADNVISCGSYTGNGSTTGPEITLGYEPQWILVKRATVSTGNWYLYDTMRGWTVEVAGNNAIYANLSNAEINDNFGRPTSTGFQVLTSAGALNENGQTYIYISIRRGPMKVPTTGTSVFSPISVNVASGTSQTTGFVVDSQWKALRTSVDTLNSAVDDRLRGVSTVTDTSTGRYVITSSVAAEATTNATTFGWNNTGFLVGSYYSSQSSVFWNFGRAPGFFDEVCYTGTGANRTVTHSLTVAPELIIVKRRDTSGAWDSYSASLANTEYVVLNTTAAKATGSTRWNSTSPTASVFSLGTAATVNASGGTYAAYLFATCSGVSKVGSYTGTGTTLQINCGFTAGARFILIKRTDSTGDWYVWDSARGIVSGNDPYLLLNSTAAEVTNTDYVDTYSAGFEISSTAPAAINASGGSFIFLAIS